MLDHALHRVRPVLWPHAQTAAAAGAAWFLAHDVVGHPRPLFAPVAAVVAMTAGRGRRGRAALELVVGVVIGIVLADLFVRVVGVGAWQLAAVVLLTMLLATAVGAPPLVVTQSGVWAVVVVVFTHGSLALALSRFEDALVGAGVALVLSQLLFPLRPLDVLQEAAHDSTQELAEVLHAIVVALRERDEEKAEAAVRAADDLDHRRLYEALAVGQAAARAAPRRRGERTRFEVYARCAEALRRADRDVRLLAQAACEVVSATHRVPL